MHTQFCNITLSKLREYNVLFHGLFWIELKGCAGGIRVNQFPYDTQSRIPDTRKSLLHNKLDMSGAVIEFFQVTKGFQLTLQTHRLYECLNKEHENKEAILVIIVPEGEAMCSN